VKLSTVGLQVLTALAAQPTASFSGAEISLALSVVSGTLYPMLIRFEKAGLLSSEWETEDASALGRPRRKYYQISPVGQSRVAAEQSKINASPHLLGVPA